MAPDSIEDTLTGNCQRPLTLPPNSISNAVFMFKLILDKKNFHPGGVIDNGEEIMFERKRCKLGIIKQMTKEFSGVN